MEEQSVAKKKLYISPAIQVLIVDNPQASALLERLKQEQGYEVKDVVEYGTDKPGVIGHIMATDNSTTTTAPDYVINSAEGIVQVLSKLLSPEKSNAAEHSPPVSRLAPGFQGGGDSDLLRKSVGGSMDEEVDPERGGLQLRGLKPESKSFAARWCSWFTCCCGSRDEDRNPLLSSGPKPN